MVGVSVGVLVGISVGVSVSQSSGQKSLNSSLNWFVSKGIGSVKLPSFLKLVPWRETKFESLFSEISLTNKVKLSTEDCNIFQSLCFSTKSCTLVVLNIILRALFNLRNSFHQNSISSTFSDSDWIKGKSLGLGRPRGQFQSLNISCIVFLALSASIFSLRSFSSLLIILSMSSGVSVSGGRDNCSFNWSSVIVPSKNWPTASPKPSIISLSMSSLVNSDPAFSVGSGPYSTVVGSKAEAIVPTASPAISEQSAPLAKESYKDIPTAPIATIQPPLLLHLETWVVGFLRAHFAAFAAAAALSAGNLLVVPVSSWTIVDFIFFLISFTHVAISSREAASAFASCGFRPLILSPEEESSCLLSFPRSWSRKAIYWLEASTRVMPLVFLSLSFTAKIDSWIFLILGPISASSTIGNPFQTILSPSAKDFALSLIVAIIVCVKLSSSLYASIGARGISLATGSIMLAGTTDMLAALFKGEMHLPSFANWRKNSPGSDWTVNVSLFSIECVWTAKLTMSKLESTISLGLRTGSELTVATQPFPLPWSIKLIFLSYSL